MTELIPGNPARDTVYFGFAAASGGMSNKK